MRWLVLALVVAAAIARPARADEIRDVVVEGNTKTTSDTVQLIAHIDEGDDWKPEMVETIKERLRSSGLFSDVDCFYDNDPKGGVRVHITVKDKHSWIIAPAFYNQPTNTGGGVGYGENNLFGENQKLLLYGQIATGDSFFVGAWVIPSINDTRFYAQLDTYLDSSRVIEYASPTSYIDDPKAVRQSRMNYLDGGVKLGIELWRGVKIDTRLRAAHVSYQDVHLLPGATINDVLPGADPSTPIPAPGKRGWDVSNEWQFTVDRRANWDGVYTGPRYNLDYEFGVSQLGSDFDYHRFAISLYHGYRVLERHNLVLKGSLNIGHHLPFQQELETGGTSMRGWLNNQFRGDFQAIGNVEYSFPLFTLFGLSVRGLGFFDTGYTTWLTKSPDRDYLPNAVCSPWHKASCLGDGFKNSIGIGTRLLMRQIVIPLLGVDVGYGLEARDVQVYLAIGLTN